MYILFHLRNRFKCMCLHFELECFASKLEMTMSYAWSRLWVYGGGMFYCLWCVITQAQQYTTDLMYLL